MLTILAKVIPIENDMVQKDYGNLGHTGIYGYTGYTRSLHHVGTGCIKIPKCPDRGFKEAKRPDLPFMLPQDMSRPDI